MKVVELLTDVKRPCAFVPTMGALHAGHQSLIKIARELSDEVIVSVFVNPLQFEDKNDLINYPRTPERDEELAREAGATILWRPSVDQIYPPSALQLKAGDVGTTFEGIRRHGHFDGVVTVVNRLFEIVQPKYAIFGEKDFQQLFLIKEMAQQLHPDIEIVPAPTIRESSGLALSSRNVRLSAHGRVVADVISRVLHKAAEAESLIEMKRELEKLSGHKDFILDYAEVIDEKNFNLADDETEEKRAIVAGWVDGVRLIDNLAMAKKLVRV